MQEYFMIFDNKSKEYVNKSGKNYELTVENVFLNGFHSKEEAQAAINVLGLSNLEIHSVEFHLTVYKVN